MFNRSKIVIAYAGKIQLCKVLKELEDFLTEEEKEIVRRTRNTENHHVAKNANPTDYMYATAFEGLIGYL